jgi:hypothetical protein
MKKTSIPLLLLCALLFASALVTAQNKTRRLSQAVLKDKIKGGRAGQMIGVSFGAPKLEQWNPGKPDRFAQFSDPAWQWNGNWLDETQPKDYMDRNKAGVTGKVATGAGAEATLTFEGIAVCLIGPMTQEGGRADVYLDGKKLDHIDAYVVERTFDYDLWRAYDLKPGKHTLRIVTRDDADARSKGRNVILRRAIIFR